MKNRILPALMAAAVMAGSSSIPGMAHDSINGMPIPKGKSQKQKRKQNRGRKQK